MAEVGRGGGFEWGSSFLRPPPLFVGTPLEQVGGAGGGRREGGSERVLRRVRAGSFRKEATGHVNANGVRAGPLLFFFSLSQ